VKKLIMKLRFCLLLAVLNIGERILKDKDMAFVLGFV